MHLKAIRIKEELLGPDDQEVSLSIGHLASLYNFHMCLYKDAERLYYRSIDIGTYTFLGDNSRKVHGKFTEISSDSQDIRFN